MVELESTISYVDKLYSQIVTKFIVATIIIIIGFIIGKIAGRFVAKLSKELEINKILKKAGLKLNFESILSTGTSYIIYFFTLVIALNQIGMTTTILNMLGAAVLVLVVLSALLAMKDFLPNMIAGFLIFQKGLFKVGDYVKVHKFEGKVKKITLFETQIQTKKKDLIHVPNSNFTKSEIVVKS